MMTPLGGTWYPVALSSGIEPGTSNGTRLFGREIVVWRDSDGAAHVWEDRCPHRGMRLSLGFVRGDQIACLYHGWRYDAAGQCRAIPAHPQLTPPETIRVPVFASAERMGMIWVRSDGPPQAEPPPDETVTSVRSITVDCAPERALSHISAPSMPPAGGGIDADRTGGRPPPMVAVRHGDHSVVVGVQPLSADQCVLHVVVPGNIRGTGQKRVSAWAEAVRRTLELPVEYAEGLR
jgi:nitrite reductase/ring-hydroxylating ferredoxin subunit